MFWRQIANYVYFLSFSAKTESLFTISQKWICKENYTVFQTWIEFADFVAPILVFIEFFIKHLNLTIILLVHFAGFSWFRAHALKRKVILDKQ